MRGLLILSVLLTMTSAGFAAPVSKRATTAATKKAAQSTPSEYSTKMSFEGAAIKGKVQSGSLRKIVVENDKSLDDLLGVRKHFDDREQTEKGRVTTW